MNLIDLSTCIKCITDREETPLHMFYQCEYANVAIAFKWLLRILLYISNYKPTSNIKCIYFDNTHRNKQQKNICNMFISAYILTMSFNNVGNQNSNIKMYD